MADHPLPAALCQLIDALAEVAAEDYLRELADNRAADEQARTERVLPPARKAA